MIKKTSMYYFPEFLGENKWLDSGHGISYLMPGAPFTYMV